MPESKDAACHPELLTTGLAQDWCAEHGVPESACPTCHPEIARKGELPADPDRATVSSGAHENERKEDHPAGAPDPAAGAIRDPRTCQKHALKVQFASVASLAKCGVHLGQVVERPMSDSILVNAELDYDRTRFAKLAPRVAGTARSVGRALGESVRAGDVLALIDSPEIVRARAEWLEAQNAEALGARALERAQRSSEAGFRTEGERLAAEADAREAQIRLHNASEALVSLGIEQPTLGAQGGLTDASPVRAPLAGIVVSCAVVTGESVDPARTLFEIADTTHMWVTMDVPQSDAHRVSLGEEVIFRPDDARDEVVVGRVAWMSTAVDEMTRTVKVRADVGNPTGALRAHSFGRAQIVVRASPQAVAVPTDAVQWEGCCFVVFVRVGEAIFQTRKVRVGAKDSDYTEVLGGLVPGEIVVTTGSHVLKSEILKSSLGAGCTDE
ncbi:MAG: efflux RND transporter periplasmic adaptor subunit [Planctomycetes bacterium]|nr:efflux RND transporter periplasmic adaptor subunit [Planctomycetota bacterium]